MTPFHWLEVKGRGRRSALETLWYRGGFPDAYLKSSNSERIDWFDAYTHGGIWSAFRLAASLGVSYHTVNHYTDILSAKKGRVRPDFLHGGFAPLLRICLVSRQRRLLARQRNYSTLR